MSEENKEILSKTCIEAIGEDICRKYKSGICKGFGKGENGWYCFYGISASPSGSARAVLTHEKNWDIYVIAAFDKQGNPCIVEKRGKLI